MKMKFLAGLATGLLTTILISGNTYATAILDSSSGGDYSFQWGGVPGQIDEIYETDGPGSSNIDWTNLGNDWSITVTEDSYLDMATVWDDFIPGDIFGLILDGTSASWTSTSTDTSGYFRGIYEDLFLSAGTHIFTLDVTSGLVTGGAWASFSGTSPVAPVPEPATMLLFGTGLAGLAGRRIRRKKK